MQKSDFVTTYNDDDEQMEGGRGRVSKRLLEDRWVPGVGRPGGRRLYVWKGTLTDPDLIQNTGACTLE